MKGLYQNAVYLSPTGRRCRWIPLLQRAHLYFEYVDGGRIRDGFTLSAANMHLVRLERRP